MPASDFVIIGACHTDRLHYLIGPVMACASNPVTSQENPGGVGHNIACNLAFLNQGCTFMGLMGEDHMARNLKSHLDLIPFAKKTLLSTSKAKTASYTAILDHEGELYIGLADMDIYGFFTNQVIKPYINELTSIPNWIIDANLAQSGIDYLFENAQDACIYAAPVSPTKALKFKPHLSRINVLIANKLEAQALTDRPITSLDDAMKVAHHLQHINHGTVIITMGPQGGVMVNAQGELHMAPTATDIVNVNGCGDAFFAGCAHAIANNNPNDYVMAHGLSLAHFTTKIKDTINKDVTSDELHKHAMALVAKTRPS